MSCYYAEMPGGASGNTYSLVNDISGTDFFDSWTFTTNDANWGASHYLNRQAAEAAGIIEAHEDYAILRTGARSWNGGYKRESVRLETTGSWTYFLAAAFFTHIPAGCGVWPAWWTHSHDVGWPNGGELDMLEFANNFAGKSSFHTGAANNCTLIESVVNTCSATQGTFTDENQGGAGSIYSTGWGECYTDYNPQELPMELGASHAIERSHAGGRTRCSALPRAPLSSPPHPRTAPSPRPQPTGPPAAPAPHRQAARR
jgi:hypothetical protein